MKVQQSFLLNFINYYLFYGGYTRDVMFEPLVMGKRFII